MKDNKLSELHLNYWAKVPIEALDELLQSSQDAMADSWGEWSVAFRHLMNSVLFISLLNVRAAIDEGSIEEKKAIRVMREDFGLGYLFGLAANYVDASGIDRNSTEAKTAIYDVYNFTFGQDEGSALVSEQNLRTTDSFSQDFQNGIMAAHSDANGFKRFLNGNSGESPTGLTNGIMERVGKIVEN